MNVNKSNNKKESDRRIRSRLRGMMESKSGKAVGITSLVVPAIGYILNDLRKPNSIARQLIGKAVDKFLKLKTEKVEAIDITDKVEIVNISDQKKLHNN